jgi:predicted nucleic acid-binding Zn ribbon protein
MLAGVCLLCGGYLDRDQSTFCSDSCRRTYEDRSIDAE